MDVPYNAGDRKAIRRAEKLAKQLENEKRDIVRQICSTEAGRRYLWTELSSAHIFHTSFVSTEALQMAFLEGERNQGLRLLNSVLLHAPEQFVLMMQEHNTQQAQPTDEEDGEEDDEVQE